jgi:hypothetical protein
MFLLALPVSLDIQQQMYFISGKDKLFLLKIFIFVKSGISEAFKIVIVSKLITLLKSISYLIGLVIKALGKID